MAVLGHKKLRGVSAARVQALNRMALAIDNMKILVNLHATQR